MTDSALSMADGHRRDISPNLDETGRKSLGQFMTPMGIARMLAAYFDSFPNEVRLLDAGAGMGALTAAFVEAACAHPVPPRSISVTCFEVDPEMVAVLQQTLARCAADCAQADINFQSDLIADDYILRSAEPLFVSAKQFNCAILNPPYGKINASSKWRNALRSQGIETVNLYTGFVALALQQLEPNGQLVAITPRSFCNGPYYEPFRRLLLDQSALRAIHVFESRKSAFREDGVLQENIIFHLERGGPQNGVALSTDLMAPREVHFSEVVRRDDPHAFIRLPIDGPAIANAIQLLPCTLASLGLTVSTGRVVDFRAKEHLRHEPGPDTIPLIYPGHFEGETVTWPRKNFKKHNAIADCPETNNLLVPAGSYVLTKRFTAKEEKRRVVAAIYSGGRVGFENHLNYFHIKGSGLPDRLAKGLARYLNSQAVDAYFRSFSGHTQVNATDLRNMQYPSRSQLETLSEEEDVDTAIASFAAITLSHTHDDSCLPC